LVWSAANRRSGKMLQPGSRLSGRATILCGATGTSVCTDKPAPHDFGSGGRAPERLGLGLSPIPLRRRGRGAGAGRCCSFVGGRKPGACRHGASAEALSTPCGRRNSQKRPEKKTHVGGSVLKRHRGWWGGGRMGKERARQNSGRRERRLARFTDGSAQGRGGPTPADDRARTPAACRGRPPRRSASLFTARGN